MIGTGAGILTGIIICIIVFKLVNKDGNAKTKYDEMQERIRGKAYMYGFWAMLACEAIMLIVDTGDVKLPVEPYITHITVILIGALVQTSYSIWNDAYVGLNTNMRRFAIISILVSLLNFLIAGAAIASSRMLVDGVFQSPLANLLCGLLFCIIGIELFIKMLSDKNAKED